MKTLQSLYSYLTEGEIQERFNEGVRILIKVGKFSNESEAASFISEAAEAKVAGLDLTKDQVDIINFFSQYKREKAPLRHMLKNMKAIHASMPHNTGITFTVTN